MNVLHTGYLNMRASSAEQKKRKENDQARLLQFMRDYQPHVCVLGAANLQCRHLSNDIFEVRMFYVHFQMIPLISVRVLRFLILNRCGRITYEHPLQSVIV